MFEITLGIIIRNYSFIHDLSWVCGACPHTEGLNQVSEHTICVLCMCMRRAVMCLPCGFFPNCCVLTSGFVGLSQCLTLELFDAHHNEGVAMMNSCSALVGSQMLITSMARMLNSNRLIQLMDVA